MARSKTAADKAFNQTFETQGGRTAMIARKKARIDAARNKVRRERRAAAARVVGAVGIPKDKPTKTNTPAVTPRTKPTKTNTPAVTPRTKPKPPKTKNPLARSSISGKPSRMSTRLRQSDMLVPNARVKKNMGGKIRGYGLARGGRVCKSS